MELTTGPWSCEICGKVLSRKQRLITHKLNVHQIELSTASKSLNISSWCYLVANSDKSYHGNAITLTKMNQDTETIIVYSNATTTYTVKQYKQYLKDPNIPVPDRTWYRHKKRKIDRNGEESAQTGSENIPSNSNVSFSATCTNVFCDSLDENSTVSSAESEPIINCNSIHAGDSEILHHGIYANCHIGAEVDSMYNATDNNGDQDKENDLFYGEDIEFEDDKDCDSNTSIDENSFIDSDNNTDDSEECNNVLQKGSREFTFQDEKCMALLSFILRYNLSGQAAQSLMKLLQLFGNFDKISFTQLKQIVGTCTANIVHFCDMCYTLFPEDEEVFHCPQEGCIGLRYKGNLNRQYLKQRKSFFACLPIVQQIKGILEREGMW
ncbi:hypothetical protein KUTeg_009078 [Tegillarca granosa]|uniref:C2H2-type domain-containing protein n=1 Tax=Tegillarca granosa TaxID=220873 RepID=A0ABQ9F7M5_TEGGR|nr:hypothetical protein KUTeg_009078 [Tegillarca granosa]